MDKNIIKKLYKFIQSLEQRRILDWIKKLKKEFAQAEVYLVGGAVRDALIDVAANKDLDFVVCGVPMRKLELFLSKLGWVEKLGKSFGVLKFKPKNLSHTDDGFEALDIALPRQEISLSPGKYKDFKVKFDKNLKIEDDLGHRDFTINAIAVRVDDEVEARFIASQKRKGVINRVFTTNVVSFVIDPFNGISDIRNKTQKLLDLME